MSSDVKSARAAGDQARRFAGGVLVLVGLHFVAELALGAVHAVPGNGLVSQAYALLAAALFVGVGGTLLAKGRLADRRLEWVGAALAVVVLALVLAPRLL
jgi:hypothetical protein